MKKRISIIVALMLVLGLTACGDSSKQSSNENELTMWVQYSKESAEGKVMEESSKLFNEDESHDYTVKVEYIPRSGSGGGYEDKINAALTTDTLPDVLTLDGPNTAAYADAGILMEIDADLMDDDFLESIVEQGTYNDKIYAIGYSESGVGIFYNKSMFEEAGISLDEVGTLENPWTWDEFKEFAHQLKEHFDAPAIDMGFDDHSEWLFYAFTPYIWSAGGDIIDEEGSTSTGYFNSPETLEAMTFIQSLVAEGLSTISPSEAGFQTEKYPMYMSGSWTMQELDEEYGDVEYGIMPYPVSPKTKELVSPTGSWQYGISANSDKKEAAHVLLKFLTSEEELYRMSMGNSVLPARHSVAERMLQEVSEPMQVLIKQNQMSGQSRPVLVNYPKVTRTVQETITELSYYDEVKDIQALLDKKASEIDTYLE